MTFKSRVTAFKKSAAWLDASIHGPALEVLTTCATELDKGNVTGNMITAFRQTWSALMQERPKTVTAVADPIDALIDGLSK